MAFDKTIYARRNVVEQGYKQVKQELGWADFQVRSDRAIRRHWALVCCAFCFCWWAESQRDRADATALADETTRSLPLAHEPGAGEKSGPRGSCATRDLATRAHQLPAAAVLAAGAAPGAELA